MLTRIMSSIFMMLSPLDSAGKGTCCLLDDSVKYDTQTRCSSATRGASRRAEHRCGPLLGQLAEGHPDRQADGQRLRVTVHDVGHQPWPFLELDDGRHVRTPLAERGEIVAEDDR